MGLKNIARKLLFSRMSHRMIENFYKVYYRIRYPGQMERKYSFGNNNPDKTFYIVRPRVDGTEGLMSLFFNVIKNLHYADEKNYEPIIDFENYHTQYVGNVNGINNAWEFYFTQPTCYSLDEVYKSKNVILSGLNIQWYRSEILRKSFDDVALNQLHDYIFSKIDFNDSVKGYVDDEINRLGIHFVNALGLYLRGTDYTALKPAGHPIQPTVEQAVEIVEQFRNKYKISQIFLVTEDYEIYKRIKEIYKELCITVSFDSFIKSYKGKKLIGHDISINEIDTSSYIRGLHYLLKLILLSKCRYFVGGNTMGSWAACVFKEKQYKDKYVFDLGYYGK